jgi:carboxyl-terminal processing protease
MLMKQTGDLMDKAIKGMLANLDPYTVYFNEQDVVRFKINNTGEYWNRRAIDSKRGQINSQRSL